MRSPFLPFTLLLLSCSLSSQCQVFTKCTTEELFTKAQSTGTAFLNAYPEQEIHYALPLIDSDVAIKLALLRANENVVDPFADGYPDYVFAIGLQCKNDSLKSALLHFFDKYDCRCADSMSRSSVDQTDFVITPVGKQYAYNLVLRSALYKQLDKNDSVLITRAFRGFKFWGGWLGKFRDTMMGAHILQPSIYKRKYDPCLFASGYNGTFWRNYIRLLTGKEEIDFSDENLNKIYTDNRLKTRVNVKDSDDLKDFIRPGKAYNVVLNTPCNNLDSLDFDTQPVLKEKLDEVKKHISSEIIIYTHNDKALLFEEYIDKGPGFSKQAVSIVSEYMLQLNSPTIIQFTKITYRTRYFYSY